MSATWYITNQQIMNIYFKKNTLWGLLASELYTDIIISELIA